MGRKSKRKRKRKASSDDQSSDDSQWNNKRARSESRKFHYITTEDKSLSVAEEIMEEKVVGVDLKGVELGRRGRITYVAIAWPGNIACLDIKLLDGIPPWTKAILETQSITKVMHDCRGDTENLYCQYGIKLQGVFDTTVANLVDRRLRRKGSARFNNLVEIVRMETKPHKQLPIYMFGSEVVNVSRFKKRMSSVWKSTGRESVWGKSPLSKFEQKYATLNCLLTIVLHDHYIKKWSDDERWDFISERIEDVSSYFARAYNRRVKRTHHVPRLVKRMIKKPMWRAKKRKRESSTPPELDSSSDEPIRMPKRMKKMTENLVTPSVDKKMRKKVKQMTLKIFPSMVEQDLDLD